jgi:acyl-CoA thioester hydrolase
LSAPILSASTRITVRFSEADPMGIVWHGNYLKYFEDGREAFGRKYEFDYLSAYHQGIYVPLVQVDLRYKKSLQYNEAAIVETTFIDTAAAKIQYKYKIFREVDNELVTTGSTTQVFVDENRNLILNTPPSFLAWKRKWRLIA